jgi:hypothetical protein
MPFIGNQPALSYTSFAKQDFTVTATTSYSLDHPVANSNELALFINFVRQEPTTSYSASGTTLTLTEATSVGDDMYCVYLGKAVQTVNPPNASVGASQIVDASITSGKLASGVLPTNTPAFFAHKTSNQEVTDGTDTKVTWDSVPIDTDNAFDTTNNRFVVPSGKAGIYMFNGSIQTSAVGQSEYQYGFCVFYKNGSRVASQMFDNRNNNLRQIPIVFNQMLNLAVSDYIEIYVALGTSGSDERVAGESSYIATWFSGHKLIT